MTTDTEYMRMYRQGQRRTKSPKREIAAVTLMAQGLTDEQIAQRMGIEARTVERYLWRYVARHSLRGKQQAIQHVRLEQTNHAQI